MFLDEPVPHRRRGKVICKMRAMVVPNFSFQEFAEHRRQTHRLFFLALCLEPVSVIALIVLISRSPRISLRPSAGL